MPCGKSLSVGNKCFEATEIVRGELNSRHFVFYLKEFFRGTHFERSRTKDKAAFPSSRVLDRVHGCGSVYFFHRRMDFLFRQYRVYLVS